MEPRNRIVGSITEVTARDARGSPTAVTVDFGRLVRQLVVSEQFIIQSTGLMELPLLIEKFGYDGTKALLESGRVRILSEAAFIANIGQYSGRTNGPVLPLGSYSFSVLRATTPREMMSQQLHQIDKVPGLNARQAKKLRSLVGGCLRRLPEDLGQAAEEQFCRELEANVPMLKTAVAMSAKRKVDLDVPLAELDLHIERLNERDWHTATNLASRAHLTQEQLHTVIGDGLSAVCAMSLQLDTMKTLSALTGFQAGDLPLLEEKYEFLGRQIDPDLHDARLVRVCDIAGLPAVSADPTVADVDIARLLEITATPEAQEFRSWLRGIDSFTDQELAEALHPLRDAIGKAVRSPAGKVVRLAATTGIGVMVPPAGIGLSVLDAFLVEKVMLGPGPTAFLSRSYRSVFDHG